jgi:hypothetical protein
LQLPTSTAKMRRRSGDGLGLFITLWEDQNMRCHIHSFAFRAAIVLVGMLPVGLLPRASAQDKPSLLPSWEFKAVSIGTDEKEATRKLNDLGSKGWELIGPLANGLVAFKRPVLSAQQIAANKELAKWEGEWQSGNQSLIIREGRWRWGETGKFTLEEFPENRITIVKLGEPWVEADLLVAEGDMKGQVCRAIFRLEGDTLRYCGSYGDRPTGFDDGRGYAVEWKRAKK